MFKLTCLLILAFQITTYSQDNYNAGTNSSSGMGVNNTVVGVDAGNSLSTGNSNSLYGRQAGPSLTTGFSNCFYGVNTGNFNTSGGRNSFFGTRAGFDNTSGGRNCFFGDESGNNNTIGTNNSFIGTGSGFLTTSGRDNVFIGERAGRNNATGSGNIAIGRGAGPTATNMALSDRLYIDIADVTASSETGNDNPLIYGEFDNDFVRINGTFEVTAGLTNPSSRTLKNQFISLDASTILSKLSDLDIQQWTYKARPDEKHVGPVAEDFYEAFGLGQGDENISTIDADGIMMLAIQELNRELKKQNEELRKENERISEQNLLILRRLEALENGAMIKQKQEH